MSWIIVMAGYDSKNYGVSFMFIHPDSRATTSSEADRSRNHKDMALHIKSQLVSAFYLQLHPLFVISPVSHHHLPSLSLPLSHSLHPSHAHTHTQTVTGDRMIHS